MLGLIPPRSIVLSNARRSGAAAELRLVNVGAGRQGGAVNSVRNSVARMVSAGRALLRRKWQRALALRERIVFSEEAFHLLLAGIVGVLGAVTNLVFYLALESVKYLALGSTGDLTEIAHQLSGWQRVVAPVAGALLAGLVLHRGLKHFGERFSTNLLEVVVAGDGRLPFRVGLVKSLASLLSLGTGASIGREGSITQMTATLASAWGRVSGWQPYRLRLLVACGAASGIAAAYNAPIGGAVFAAQVVLGNFSMHLFGPLVFSSVVASVLSRSFFGLAPLYRVPEFDFTRLSQLPWFLLLGLVAGVAGALFLKSLRWSEAAFQRVPVPGYVRMTLGGLVVGIIAVGFPDVWGNGHAVTTQILNESLPLKFLAALLLAKLLATVASVGSGTVGGVFTPTLFLGAAVGSMFGGIVHELGWGTALPTWSFALVGMGGVLAATTHSPLLAMIIVFEISLDYSLVPPLMLACAISSLVASRLHRDSIYTAPLRARGLAEERDNLQVGAATRRTVGELMREPVPPVRENTPLPEIGERFLTSAYNFLPVVDGAGRLVGVVGLHDLKDFLKAGEELAAVIAADVMRPVPACLTPSQSLLEALPTLLASELRNVPVVNSQHEKKLVGAVPRSEALGLLSEAIATLNATKE